MAIFKDDETGLRAIIAVHNTNLGPALGGVRMWPYTSDSEAVRDVLRLSRGMTYKSALAGLPFGGGMSVKAGIVEIGRINDAAGGLLSSSTTVADFGLSMSF